MYESSEVQPHKPEDGPVIGLALGSGSARGWAHIGVIRALQQAGIYPDVVAGSSIGALVGAAYAAGYLDQLEHWVGTFSWREVIRYLDVQLKGGGLIQGERLLEFLRLHVEDRVIESMERPFAAVATELETGQEVWLRQGSMMDAVRASIALPGLFAPVGKDGRWLADGGLVNPVPVSLCRALGAQVVIAVNLNGDLIGRHFRKNGNHTTVSETTPNEPQNDLWGRLSDQLRLTLKSRAEAWLTGVLGTEVGPGMFDVLATSINIMQDRITRSRMAGDPPDIILAPRLAHLGLLEFDRADEAIGAGTQAVQRMLPSILDAINNGVDLHGGGQ